MKKSLSPGAKRTCNDLPSRTRISRCLFAYPTTGPHKGVLICGLKMESQRWRRIPRGWEEEREMGGDEKERRGGGGGRRRTGARREAEPGAGRRDPKSTAAGGDAAANAVAAMELAVDLGDGFLPLLRLSEWSLLFCCRPFKMPKRLPYHCPLSNGQVADGFLPIGCSSIYHDIIVTE
ncbi:hypothetical protein BHE74_00009321 [Ensete ventricosum]|nr:hypothetical protein BHE74_00009321 [Ensete ventricosum]RZR86965.1 hypothetical protein BHM03_00014264 [Ensete ventricosum]